MRLPDLHLAVAGSVIARIRLRIGGFGWGVAFACRYFQLQSMPAAIAGM